MKNYITIGLFIFVAIFASCTSPGRKFVGKWRSVHQSLLDDNTTILIKKNGGDYKIISNNLFGNASTLHYEKDEDCLSGDAGGITIAVKYNKKTKHITIGPKNIDFISQFIEFERTR